MYWQYIVQIIGGDFTKFCGLLRTYELYSPVLKYIHSEHTSMYIKQGSHTNISAYVQSVAHAALYFWVINKLSSDPFFYDFLFPFFTKHFSSVNVWLLKN